MKIFKQWIVNFLQQFKGLFMISTYLLGNQSNKLMIYFWSNLKAIFSFNILKKSGCGKIKSLAQRIIEVSITYLRSVKSLYSQLITISKKGNCWKAHLITAHPILLFGLTNQARRSNGNGDGTCSQPQK